MFAGCFLRFRNIRGFDDIGRAMLRFQIRFRQVLAEDADGEELDAAQEQDDADERGPALHGIAEEEVAHDDE